MTLLAFNILSSNYLAKRLVLFAYKTNRIVARLLQSISQLVFHTRAMLKRILMVGVTVNTIAFFTYSSCDVHNMQMEETFRTQILEQFGILFYNFNTLKKFKNGIMDF